MSKLSILVSLILSFSINYTYAQVWEGDYLIESQNDIDVFPTACNCTEITGNLTIEEGFFSYINHLDGLTQLTSVGGNLKILLWKHHWVRI